MEVARPLLLGVHLVAAAQGYGVALGGPNAQPSYLPLGHLPHKGGLGDDADAEHIRLQPRVGLQEIAEIGRDHLHVAGGVVSFLGRYGRLGSAYQTVIPVAHGLGDAAGAPHGRQAPHLQIVGVPQTQQHGVLVAQIERVDVSRGLGHDLTLVVRGQLLHQGGEVEHHIVHADDGRAPPPESVVDEPLQPFEHVGPVAEELDPLPLAGRVLPQIDAG